MSRPTSNFLQRHIANLALAIELSALSAVIVFMISATLGHSTHTIA
jgi:hypothetical protein